MTDPEILCQAVEQYAVNTVKALFGFSSLPTQTLVRYAIRNVFQKYSGAIQVFTDGSGKIRTDLLFGAFKAELKDHGGFTMFGVHFSEADIEEISKIYQSLTTDSNV